MNTKKRFDLTRPKPLLSWPVPSSSGSNEYLVTQHRDGTFVCTCRGWKFSKRHPKSCKHSRKIAKRETGVCPNCKVATPRCRCASMKSHALAATTGFIRPMLAKPMPKTLDYSPGRWAAEQKFDGHRRIIEVVNGRVTAWSRAGNVQVIKPKLLTLLQQFPNGTYDGEQDIKGGKSKDVKRTDRRGQARIVLFDILRSNGETCLDISYDNRRRLLEEIFRTLAPDPRHLLLASSVPIETRGQQDRFLRTVWKDGGEGIIVKNRKAVYTPGKRTYDFMKIKKLESAVLVVVGFEASKGDIQNRGPYAIVQLLDSEGHRTTVKTKNDKEIVELERTARAKRQHPAIGRRLRIEFQERTEDGSYREPRWDRWENE